MGVEVVVAGATPAELDAVRGLFERWDRVFSRFRPDSELSRVNASRAETVVVSPLFARVLRVALVAADRTGGLVDPTLGGAIEAAGYDRDFAELLRDARPPRPAAGGRHRDVELSGRVLMRPAGLRLDLNGVVKALAVDGALALLSGNGLVSAGGDLALRGVAVVGLPAGGAVTLRSGGLATSGTTRRRWQRGGRTMHHLLDPRTGRPADSRWQEVTVAARTCLAADVAAKTAFLLSDDGSDWLERRGLPGRFVGAGEVLESPLWSAELCEAA